MDSNQVCTQVETRRELLCSHYLHLNVTTNKNNLFGVLLKLECDTCFVNSTCAIEWNYYNLHDR
jgi:hypothetical protein